MFSCYANTIIFLFITSTCQYLMLYFCAVVWITFAFANVPSTLTPILAIESFIIATMFTNFILWFIWIMSWFILSHISPINYSKYIFICLLSFNGIIKILLSFYKKYINLVTEEPGLGLKDRRAGKGDL